MEQPIIIFWTSSNYKEAKAICQDLLLKKFVACTTIFPSVYSLFIWEEKLVSKKEVKVMMKTTKTNYKKIERAILEKSSYDTPEILAVHVDEGSKEYLKWLTEQTQSS